MAPHAERRGLTLLEVLVTVAILSAVTALVLPAVYSRLGPLAFDEAAAQLQAALRAAQADAARVGEPVRITASRPTRRSGYAVFASPFGPDEDPAEVWIDTAAADPGSGAGGSGGDPLLDPSPAFPVPDAAIPPQAIGATDGRLLQRLPDSVRLEQRAGVDEPPTPFASPGDAPRGRLVARPDQRVRTLEPEGPRSLTIAVILADGSILMAPGAAIVDADGRRALLGVEPWTGRAVVGVEPEPDPDDAPEEPTGDDRPSDPDRDPIPVGPEFAPPASAPPVRQPSPGAEP